MKYRAQGSELVTYTKFRRVKKLKIYLQEVLNIHDNRKLGMSYLQEMPNIHDNRRKKLGGACPTGERCQ